MFFRIVLFVIIANTALSKRVLLSTGEIEGKVLNATYSPLGNQSAIVFLGIPYVAPPLGDLRFRKPKPPIPWKRILETKAYRPACMSNATKTYKNTVGGPISEDCLYANVFTNEYCLEKKNCSVMIAIHGGDFVYESASAFDPEILINNFVGQNRNIVVVSLNYRLGAFGFGHLAGDDLKFKLNFFFSYILAGVKWVRREIHSFGGNKHKITLMGHSAGAELTALFSMSPLTKGFIHQQIVMSGPLTNLSKKSNYKAMTKITQTVGCLSEDVGFEPLSKIQLKKGPGHLDADHPDPGHPEPGHPDPGHPEPGHPDPGHPDPGHPDPGHPEPGHPDPGHPEPGHPDPGHPEPGHPDPGHPDPGHPEPGHPDPGHPDPGHPEPGHPDPGHPDPGHPDPGHPDPGHPDPGHPDPGHPEPGHPEPGHPDPGHPEPGHPDPGHPDPGHPDPGHPDPGPRIQSPGSRAPDPGLPGHLL
ncbi:unnamed protein product [Caenorhabditis nigoni]